MIRSATKLQPQARRNGRASLGALLLWGLAGFAAAAPAPEPDRPAKSSPHLVTNTANAERFVVSGVCEAAGIRQIADLLKRAEAEEMWAFLPRASGSGACEWHEIGRDEKGGAEGAYVRVDMRYVERLMAQNREIHLVHFHPLAYFQCAADAACPREAAGGPAASVDKRWITDLLFSMPSPSDVHFMMDATSRFHRKHQPQGTIRHRVVTPYGTVDYGLTEAGLAKFDYERHSRTEGRYITWVVASGLADDSLALVAKDHPGNLAAAVRGLAQSLNTQFLRIKYTP